MVWTSLRRRFVTAGMDRARCITGGSSPIAGINRISDMPPLQIIYQRPSQPELDSLWPWPWADSRIISSTSCKDLTMASMMDMASGHDVLNGSPGVACGRCEFCQPRPHERVTTTSDGTGTYRKESLKGLRVQREAKGDVTDTAAQQKRKQHEVQLLAPRVRWEGVLKPHKALLGQARCMYESGKNLNSCKGLARHTVYFVLKSLIKDWWALAWTSRVTSIRMARISDFWITSAPMKRSSHWVSPYLTNRSTIRRSLVSTMSTNISSSCMRALISRDIHINSGSCLTHTMLRSTILRGVTGRVGSEMPLCPLATALALGSYPASVSAMFKSAKEVCQAKGEEEEEGAAHTP